MCNKSDVNPNLTNFMSSCEKYCFYSVTIYILRCCKLKNIYYLLIRSKLYIWEKRIIYCQFAIC